MSDKGESAATIRTLPAVAGLALLLVYVRVGDLSGYHALAGENLQFVATSELRFWLFHALVAIPGVVLLGFALEPRLGPLVDRWLEWLDRLAERQATFAALVGVALALVAVVGRRLVLLDQPITDDENGVLFGARMLAAGQLSVPQIPYSEAFTTVFTLVRDGRVLSMDFPGALAVAALALVTRLGSLVYAGLVGLTGWAVARGAAALFSPRGRVLSAAVWTLSPMVLMLSFTTHAHLVSRAFLALAFSAYLRLAMGASERLGREAALLGLAAGLAFLTRPFETACLMAPVAVDLGRRAIAGSRGERRVVAVAALGSLGPLILFALYNAATTGRWYLQARFAEGLSGTTTWNEFSAWDRIATNLGHNVAMLTVFFVGPLVMAVWLARFEARPVARVLGSGVVAMLLLGLAHDDSGIHTVGPIHYSEAALPLTFLLVAGLLSLTDHLSRLPSGGRAAGTVLVSYLVGGLLLFDYGHAVSLRRQAENNRAPFAAVEAAGVHDAIVMAPQPIMLTRMDPAREPYGSWVFHYPHPDPFLRDDVLYVKPGSDLERLRTLFPERQIYWMNYDPRAEGLVLARIEQETDDPTQQ